MTARHWQVLTAARLHCPEPSFHAMGGQHYPLGLEASVCQAQGFSECVAENARQHCLWESQRACKVHSYLVARLPGGQGRLQPSALLQVPVPQNWSSHNLQAANTALQKYGKRCGAARMALPWCIQNRHAPHPRPKQSRARALCPYTSLSHTKAGYHAVVQDVTFDPRNYEAKRHSPQGTPSIQDSISSCRHSYAVAEACKAGRPAHTWTAQHSKQDPSAKNRQA